MKRYIQVKQDFAEWLKDHDVLVEYDPNKDGYEFVIAPHRVDADQHMWIIDLVSNYLVEVEKEFGSRTDHYYESN